MKLLPAVYKGKYPYVMRITRRRRNYASPFLESIIVGSETDWGYSDDINVARERNGKEICIAIY